ncbi:TPA: hypothetical protein ENS27_02510 [bacterium]|nr:hypothetical protein [bacterium]
MNDKKFSIKIISIIIVFILVFPLNIWSDIISKKNTGKLTMVLSLSAMAFFVKKIVNNDINKTLAIRKEIGKPEKLIEYQEGFDNWRLEWHGNYIYVFRNGIFSHKIET